MYKKEGVNTFFGANSYIIPKNKNKKLARIIKKY